MALATATTAKCQKHKDSTGVFNYIDGKIHIASVVITDSSLDKKTLFNNALIWFAKATNDYNNKLQHKDKWGLKDNIAIKNDSECTLVGTLNMNVEKGLNEILIGFDVAIYCKDGKYKYDFTNYKYINNALMSSMAGTDINMSTDLETYDIKRNKKLMILIYNNSISLINSLKNQMQVKSQTDF